MTPDGRVFGTHRTTDFADGRHEYYEIEGRVEAGVLSYTIQPESGAPISYTFAWDGADTLRGHTVGHPEVVLTFTRLR